MFFHYLDLGWRSLKRTPLISILMVCAIGVGIGITMTSLSVYHMMSMDPIPQKSDQLFAVQLNTMDDGTEWRTDDNLPAQLTYKDAMALHMAKTPERKTASMSSGFTLQMNNSEIKPFVAGARLVGKDFFDMFALTFLYGGSWSSEQEMSASSVVVIGEQLNEQLFGGKDSVGQQITLDNNIYSIVGVIQQWDINIKYYDLNNGAFNKPEEIFVPISLIAPLQLNTWGNSNGWKRGEKLVTYEDRLQSEMLWLQFWVELPAVQQPSYMDYLYAYLTEESKKGRYSREKPEFALRNVNEWMAYNKVVSEDNKVLVGLSFMFLAVCLANILGLLLGKFLRRAPEIGVRRALGASKWHIFQQHLIEVSMLGFLGGLLGIAIAQLGLWGVRFTNSNYDTLANMDVSMLLAAPVIAIFACIIAGLYPAWIVCRTQPAIYLKTQ